MTKHTKAIASNVRREITKASTKAMAQEAARVALLSQQAVETGAYNFAKGASELRDAIKSAIKLGTAEGLVRDAAMRGAMVYRLGKSLPEDAAARRDIMTEAGRVLGLKAAHLGNTDAYRSADEQRAYDAAKKIWQRAYAEAEGTPKKRKPQPAKAATSGKTDAKARDNASPAAAPLNFAEYVKRPPVLATPDDAKKQARNLAALMTAEMKQSAKALPQEVRAMYRAFVEAAKALAD